MSIVSELPAIVNESALTHPTGGSIRLDDEQSGMQVEVNELEPAVPVVAIRLGGRGGVGHVSNLRTDAGLESICDYLLVVERDGKTHAVLVELKKTWNRKAKEQLRRSLPLLEYLRSACEVERGTRYETGMTTGYLIICERRRLDKQSPKPRPVEDYRNIKIRTRVGTTISLDLLTGESQAPVTTPTVR